MAPVLRVAALAGRSLLVIILAKYLSVGDVALYGVFVATVAYALFPLGFDFYAYATREYLSKPKSEWAWIFSYQKVFTGLAYVTIGPLLLVLFFLEILPWRLAPWFFAIWVAEHIGLECDRVLIALQKHWEASVALFVRQGLFPFALGVILLSVSPDVMSLEQVFVGWLAFSGLGVTIGFHFVSRVMIPGRARKVDWAWIRRGVRVSIPFLLGTLALRALFTLDRHYLQELASSEELASYVVFMALANGMSTVVSATVHQYIYPRMVIAVNEGDVSYLRSLVLSMTIRTSLVCALASGAIVAGLPVLLDWTGEASYRNYDWIVLPALGVLGVFNLSLVPHYVLYARRADLSLTLVAGFSFFTFFICAFIISAPPVELVLTSLACAFSTMLVLKLVIASFSVRQLKAEIRMSESV